MTITKKNTVATITVLIGWILALCIGYVEFTTDLYKAIAQIGLMAAVSMGFTIAAIFYATKKKDAFFYFILLSYFFSFGQSILTLIGYTVPSNIAFSITNGYFSGEVYLSSARFSVSAISIVTFGYLVSHSNCHCNNISENKELYFKDRALNVAWKLLLVSIVPTYYLLYQDIIGVVTNGYGSTLVNASGISKIFSIISGLFPSSILLIYALEEKYRKGLFVIIASYFFLQLAGGSRIEVFRFLIMMLLISDLYRKELTRKRWIIVVVIGLGAAFVFSLVSNIRTYIFITDDIVQMISNAAKDLVKKNFIFEAIKEMGNTQITNALVYTYCPSKVGYHYGFSLIQMLWGIIPNFIGNAYTAANGIDVVFSPLYTRTNAGIGASFIAEGYWNFGYFAVVYYFMFGKIWAYLCNEFDSFCAGRKDNAMKLWITLFVIYYMVFMVRSESLTFGRNLVYYAIIPAIICRMVIRKRNM